MKAKRKVWVGPLAISFSLLAIAVVPIWRLFVFPDHTILFRDFGGLFLPVRMLIVRHWERFGSLPFWTHSIMGGAPFLSDNGLAPLHPLNLVYILLGSGHMLVATAIFIGLQFLLATVGWFYVFRQFRLTNALAVLATCLMVWNGPAISVVFLPQIFAGTVVFPWLIVACRKFQREPRRSSLLLLAVLLTWPILCGEFQITYLFSVGLFLYLVRERKDVFSVGAVIALTLVLSAIQVLPTFDLLQKSNRAIGALQAKDILQWSMPPERFLEVFLPRIYGFLTDLSNYGERLRSNGPEPTPFVFDLYLGAPVLLALILFGCRVPVLLRRKFPKATRPKRAGESVHRGPEIVLHWSRLWPMHWRMTLLVVLSLWAALGVFAPLDLYRVFSELIPLWGAFRYPERIVVWPLLLLQLFAILYLHRMWRFWWMYPTRPVRPTILYFFGAMITFLLAFGFAMKGNWLSLATFSAFNLAFALILLRERLGAAPAPFWRQMFLGILLLQSFVFAVRALPVQSAKVLDPAQNILAGTVLSRVQAGRLATKNIGADGFVAIDAGKIDWERLRASDAKDDLDRIVRQLFTSMSYNSPAYFGIPNVLGYAPLALPERIQMWSTIKLAQRSRLLDLWGVRHIYLRSGDFRTVLAENPGALPKFYFAREIQAVDRFPAVEELLALDAGRKEVILDTRGFPSAIPDFTGIIQDDIQPIQAAESSRGYRVELPPRERSSLLVWNNTYHPNWKAFVAGQEVPVLRVNGVSIGVWLGEEASQSEWLELRYEERFFFLGAMISLLGWIATIAGLVVWSRKPRRPRRGI